MDFENKIFRVADDSPMLKLGFKNFDSSKIGLTSDFQEKYRKHIKPWDDPGVASGESMRKPWDGHEEELFEDYKKVFYGGISEEEIKAMKLEKRANKSRNKKKSGEENK